MVTTPSPKVSVIIPTHNRAAVLGENLPAILDQAFAYFEVIVVNDRSTDETAAMLGEFGDRITVINSEAGSPAAARNAGAAAAKGEFLLFTDDDCAVPLGWISKLMGRYLALAPDALSGGIAPASLATRAERYQHYRMRLLFGDRHKDVDACPVINFLIPRSLFNDVGGFDESFPFSLEDWEFCLRLRRQGRRIVYTPAAAVKHRYHDNLELVLERLMETARGGPALARKTGNSVARMMFRSTVKWLTSPLWSIWSFPMDCYLLSLRVETRFYFARLGSFLKGV